jgi:hypothetical protein
MDVRTPQGLDAAASLIIAEFGQPQRKTICR